MGSTAQMRVLEERLELEGHKMPILIFTLSSTTFRWVRLKEMTPF